LVLLNIILTVLTTIIKLINHVCICLKFRHTLCSTIGIMYMG
jgi:hypothetical protein